MPDQQQSIVVVEDDAGMRKALERLLRAGGFHCVSFASAEGLLKAGAADTAACLVLDVHLGTESGFDLQEILAVTHANVPVILMTGHDKISSAELARRTGPDGFLRKPFDGDLILDMVRRRAELLNRPA